MALDETVAYDIFAAYFVAIFVAFGFVVKSITSDVPLSRLLEGRPFLFLRVALGALLCTWYFMFEYMQWSYRYYSAGQPETSIGSWLANTMLFEEAWTIVSSTPERWWISSGICTWTVIFTLLVWSESGRRGIKFPWAYMLLGQLVAISFATALFFTALSLRPRTRPILTGRVPLLLVPLLGAMVTIYRNPHVVNTSGFMPNLLTMHGLLLVPLFIYSRPAPTPLPSAPTKLDKIIAAAEAAEDAAQPQDGIAKSPTPVLSAPISDPTPRPQVEEKVVTSLSATEKLSYVLLVASAIYIHGLSSTAFFATPGSKSLFTSMYITTLSHPAQSSISTDVYWSLFTILALFLTSGSTLSIIFKVFVTFGLSLVAFTSYVGINWTLVSSIIPIVILSSLGAILIVLSRGRTRNESRRKAMMEGLGIIEENVVPGTDKAPPKYAPRRTVVGFWHPYCNAGGGGERVLWTAIAHLQKSHPDVVSLIYSGDYPTASKEEILSKIQDRFSIKLSPQTMHFIPLNSRYMVDDTYWKRFTLLGQSLGSIYLAWEGFCGKDGLWGDIFLDTMGYAFTYPIVRLLAGEQVVIGTYTHYPTVSTDMVKRVKERSFGVENAGASGSWYKTQIKLFYYRLFTALYATCLLFSEYSMTNSSWTQAHITSLLNKGRKGFFASVLLIDEKSLEKHGGEKGACEVVFPPCDTGAMRGFGLDKRSNEIISLAQFRPEKEQWKQVEALAILFEKKPEWKQKGVKLVMMGGARHPADEARVESLKALARERGIENYVECIVNAPYGTVVERLGNAGIGLNTMQDEHFGINIVEFMAAGLIPVVHASAGPVMDIVVPYNGQRTGFHAKTPEEFAQALEEALSLSPKQQATMRKAARELAIQKFSEERFNEGWEKGWKFVEKKSLLRRKRKAAEDAVEP